MNTLITSKMFKDLSQNDRSYLYRSKSTDGFNNSVFIHSYTTEEISLSINEFNRIYGMVNDGARLSISSKAEYPAYFKLKTDILLPKEDRSTNIITLSSLLEKEVKAFFVYLNGKKIPDNVLYVYTSDYGTDIFVPYEYIPSFNGFKAFIEIVDFRDKEYIHFYSKKMTEGSVTLTLEGKKDNYFNFDDHSNNKILIYINGRLTTDNFTSSVSKESKRLSIFYGNMVNAEVEIFYNHFISYVKKDTETKQIQKVFFTIDNKFESPIHAVIPKRTLGFYRDGLRISIDEIKQESRQIYSLERENTETQNSTLFYIQDIDTDNNRFYNSYNSDYYLNRMLGNQRLSDALQGKKTNTVFDLGIENGEIDYSLILTNNDKRYNDELADKYIDKLYNTPADENYKTLAFELIRRNPSIVKNFLRNYCKTSTNYLIKKDKNDTNPIVVGAKTLVDEKTLNLDVYINSGYISIKEYSTTKEGNNTLISLPSELFKEGINYLEVAETIKQGTSNNIYYLPFDVGDLLEPDSRDFAATLVISKEVVHQYTTNPTEHLAIFQYIEKINGYLYANDKQIGYTAIKDFVIDETETNYRINFKTKPIRRFLIYFKNFSYSGTILYDKESTDAKNALVSIIYGSEENPIPVVPIGIPNLYVNDVYYTYGVDYVFSTPEDNVAIAGSLIAFTKVLKKGDLISYSFDGINNKSVVNASDMKYENSYGLLYLSDLEFPFDTDYLDIFIDGKKIFKADIDILSDKLIRIRNHQVPFNDLYIKTKFADDYEKYRFFFDAYKEDEFEIFLSKLFSKVDPSKNFEKDPSLPEPDDIYESFDEEVGENTDKNKNPEKETKSEARQNILTALYLRWLISDDARSVVVNGKKLGDKVFGYFRLYQFTGEEGGADIHIDCSKQEIIGESDIGLDCNIKPYGYAKRMDMILKALKNDGKKDFYLDEIWNLFINHSISNIILPIDFPFDVDPETGLLAHLEDNLDYFPENRKIEIKPSIKKEYDKKITLNVIPEKLRIGEGETNYISIMHNGENLNYKLESENENSNIQLEYDEVNKMFKVFSRVEENAKLIISSISNDAKEVKSIVDISIYKQPFILIENNDFIFKDHSKLKEIVFDSNIQFFIIEIENKEIIKLTQNRKENKFEITPLKQDSTKIHIKSADKENESNFEKIINIQVVPLDNTILEVDNTNLELYKDRIIELNITNSDAEELEFVYNQEELEIDRVENVISIKGLKEGNFNLQIIGKKEDCYDTTLDISILVNGYPQLTLIPEFNQILLLEEDSLNLSLNTEALSENITYEVQSQFDNLITIEKIDKTLKIRGNKIGTGKLIISCSDPLYLDNSIELPIEIQEKEVVNLDVKYDSTQYLYPDEILDLQIVSDAEEIIVEELNNTNLVEIIKIDNLNYQIKCLNIGECQIKITANMKNMFSNNTIINLPINEVTETVDLTLNDNSLDKIEFKDGHSFDLALSTSADTLEVLFNKENMLSYSIKEEENNPNNKIISLNALMVGELEISIIAKKNGFKKNIITIPCIILEKDPTPLSVSEYEVTLHLEREVEITITTPAQDFQYEIENPENVEVIKNNITSLTIKALKIGASHITIRAIADNYRESSIIIRINCIEKPITELDKELVFDTILLGENENYEYQLEEIQDAIYSIDIENKDIADVSINETNKMIVNSKIIGNTNILLSVTKDKCLPKTYQIPLTIAEKTKLNIAEETIEMKVSDTKDLFVDTDIDFDNTTDIFEISYNSENDKNIVSSKLLSNERSIHFVALSEGNCNITIKAQKENKAPTIKNLIFNIIA